MEQNLVTPSVCDRVIKSCINSDKFEVVNYKVKPFEDKEREYYKPNSILEISAQINKKINRFRFFLRKLFSEYPAWNELLQITKASEREILFYQQFLPLIKKIIPSHEIDYLPEYLYGELNTIIILEDMSLKSFKLCRKPNLHMLDRMHICLALKALAKLHAASLIILETKNTDNMFNEKSVLREEPFWKLDKDSLEWKYIESGLKSISSSVKNVDILVDRTLKVFQDGTEFKKVLIHGNATAKNMLFNYDKTDEPEQCVLLNFGQCRYYIPAYDVLTLIFSSTTKMFRQHYFTYLINYYHDRLHIELVAVHENMHVDQFITLDEFNQSVNYLLPSIKLIALLSLQDSANPGFYREIKKNDTNYRKYLYEDKTVFIQEIYKTDSIFKFLFDEMIEELVEVLEVPNINREDCYGILEKHFDTTLYDLKNYKFIEDIQTVELDVSEGLSEQFQNLKLPIC